MGLSHYSAATCCSLLMGVASGEPPTSNRIERTEYSGFSNSTNNFYLLHASGQSSVGKKMATGTFTHGS